MKNLLIRLFTIFVLLTGTCFAWGLKVDEEAVPEVPTQVAAEHLLVTTAAQAMEIRKEIENLTAMNVVSLDVVAKNVYIPEEEN